MKSVYSAVRTGPLNKAVCASSLKVNEVYFQSYTIFRLNLEVHPEKGPQLYKPKHVAGRHDI
jgi:hypothetical protein